MRERSSWFDLDDAGAESPGVIVLGLPYDGSTSLRAGAAEGPARLRAISRTCDPVTRRGTPVEGLSLRDLGDVAAADDDGRALSQRTFLDAARARLDAIPAGCFRIVLGGDNSVSIPSIRSFAEEHGSDVGVIWFDAHPDLFETYDGNPDSHACALRRAMDLAEIDSGSIALLATRSFSEQELRFIRKREIRVITAAEWLAKSASAVGEEIASRLGGRRAVYLAVDIDGFDASCAPGTGYPMPGGVGAEEFFRLLEELFRRLPVRALDVTEVAPPLDRNDMTSFLGVQVVLETLGALAAIRGSGG